LRAEQMRSRLSAGTLGLSDQLVLSLTNLGIGLILARELEPAAFGIYVVAFAVSAHATNPPYERAHRLVVYRLLG
jgi:O-antigen/teichoic acid export membrane protein